MWQLRDWRLYFAARCISTGGSLFSWIGLPVLIFQSTHSGVWTAAVASVQALPYLVLGLVAGQVADVLDRRAVMITSELASAGALLAVPLHATFADRTSPWLVLVVATLVQSSFVFFDATNFGAVPQLVGRDGIARANGTLSACSSVLECVVPGVAGVLISWGDVHSLLTIDACSFLVSAVLTARISRPLTDRRRVGHLEWSQVTEGLRYLWDHPLIRGLTLANLLISLSNGAIAGQLVIWASDRLGVGGDDVRLGVVFGAMSVGGVVGGAATDRLYRLGRPRLVVAALCLLSTAAALATTWSTSVWVAVVFLGLWEALSLAALLVGVSVRQELTPDPLMSRVSTTGRMVALGVGWPAGALLAGWVSQRSDSPALGITAGVVALPVAAAFLLVSARVGATGHAAALDR